MTQYGIITTAKQSYSLSSDHLKSLVLKMEWKRNIVFFALIFITISLYQTNAQSSKREFLVVSPRIYRAGTDEVIAVTVFNVLQGRTSFSFRVRKGSKSIAVANIVLEPKDSGKAKKVNIKIPDNARPGSAELHVSASGALSFKKKKSISIQKKGYEMFIQTDKPSYKPGEKVRFRVVAVTPNLKPASGSLSRIFVTDPTGSRIVQWKDKALDEGFISLDLTLSKKPVLGTWKITAKYKRITHHQLIKVEKYVLPKFEVSIESPSFLHENKKKFSSRICARYTYGKKVVGKLTAKFCYLYVYRWGQSKNLPCFSISKVIDGCTDIDVTMDTAGTKIYRYWYLLNMHASVTETATGITLNGTKNATLVSNEVKISFAETAQFKPGFKFTSKVLITTHDGKPALNKKINVNAHSNGKKIMEIERIAKNGVLEFEVEPPSDAKTISLRAVHHMSAPYLGRYDGKLSVYKSVKSWYSPSKTFLVIQRPKQPLEVGSISRIEVSYNPKSIRGNKLYNTLICRGIIQDSGSTIVNNKSGEKISKAVIAVYVTQKMVPKCRMMVHFVRTDGEFVGDSAEINIEKKFENEVTVSFSEDESKPGNNITINLQAAPGSRFALSAVDKSVQLLGSTSDLKADKVMKIIEGLDVGKGWSRSTKCSGGGYRPWQRRWSRSIWWGGRGSDYVDGTKAINDAGLIYFSNLDIDVKPCRERHWPVRCENRLGDAKCKSFSRAGLCELGTAMKSICFKECGYCPAMQIAFGGRSYGTSDFSEEAPIPPRRSGISGRRGPFGMGRKGGPAGPRGKPFEKPSRPKKPAKKPVLVRSDFPETWIWTEDRINANTGKKTIHAKVPDTMTTWYANAFALSSNAGIGVSSPAGLLVFQPFFVSLTLPYSVIRGETVKVPATIFNYLDSCLTIRISLEASKDFKSNSYSSKVCVCGGKSSTFTFSVTPAKIGKIPITVKAISTSENVCAKNDKMANSVGAADAVKRMLRVEPEGIKKEYNVNSLFCPQKDGQGTYSDSFQLKLPSPIVPDSVFARISVYGDLMGPSLTDLDKLLAMPYGCGEQNMVKFAPNIYIMQYLKSTNQLTKEIEDKAKEYLVSGYQRELTYKRSDGSYSAFGNSDKEGSTWLTAFVLKSYAQAKPYIFIDDKEISSTKTWLLGLQKSDGCFKEVGMVHNKRLKGGVSSGISMTAFVLMALLEAGLPVDSVKAVDALNCITKGIDNVSDPYSAALLAYTLTLAQSADRTKIMKTLNSLAKVGDGLKYWEASEGKPKTTSWYYSPLPADVEMTAYALMAYISGKDKNVIGSTPILRWLTKQRNSLGGFSSTQDTCVALQALAVFGREMYEPDPKMTVKISTPQLSHSFTITDQNRLVLQRMEVPVVPAKVNVFATGNGCALLQANVQYNVPDVKEEPKFFLSVKVKPVGAKCRHDLRVCASYAGKGGSNMALIDVKMVSGFEPVVEHLDKLLKSPSRDTLKDYEFTDGVVSLYFSKIDSKTCITFPVEESSVVIDRKKAHAKVYDYYDNSEFATTMYSVDKCLEAN